MKTRVLFLFLPLIFSCADETTDPVLADDASGIDLRNSQPGDESAYVLYQSNCDGGFFYTGDTLVVTVKERNDSTFLQEAYTEGSIRSFSVEHYMVQEAGYVLIPERFNSQMLFFYGNDTIFLDRAPQVELTQVGCRLFHDNEEFVGDFIGSLDQFQFGDIQIEDKKGISCVPTLLDLDAYILYGDHLNMVHVIQNNGSEQTIFGFLAIR